jgi:Ala-tRNA(Pro) deacylase
MTPTERLAALLHAHDIHPQRVAHPPVFTVEESERLVPRLPGMKTKNLFLRDKKGARHFLVSVPHDLAVDLDALGKSLEAGRLGFASPERLQRHLGVTPGSVSLLALVNDTAHAVELVLDTRIFEAEAVHAHPLANDATMIVARSDLQRFLEATGHAPRVIDVPGRAERKEP